MSKDTDHFLSRLLHIFRKPHITQRVLFKLLQSWQWKLDNGRFSGTVLIDLSKACDCILQELIIAKLECYGAYKRTLKATTGLP